MKKKMLSVLLASAMVISLITGCGAKEEQTAPSGESSGAESGEAESSGEEESGGEGGSV